MTQASQIDKSKFYGKMISKTCFSRNCIFQIGRRRSPRSGGGSASRGPGCRRTSILLRIFFTNNFLRNFSLKNEKFFSNKHHFHKNFLFLFYFFSVRTSLVNHI